jgi:CIC family chloride channel protein
MEIRQLIRDLRSRIDLPYTLTTLLACVIGLLGGVGAVVFTKLLDGVSSQTLERVLHSDLPYVGNLLFLVPAVGIFVAAWLTRTFAPEAQGHGVPEVIVAVARKEGVIRPRVSLIKIMASAVSIGTGGSVGREGPIVQIGASVGSAVGQLFRLRRRNLKVLVAAGVAAGISATFNAPLAGVIFASEIIIGSFAIQYLTPIVLASVLADVVQHRIGEYGLSPVFRELSYEHVGSFSQLPPCMLFGVLCGVAAVSFTKLLYATEDFVHSTIRKWWLRALVVGAVVGLVAMAYPDKPQSALNGKTENEIPAVLGVGYSVVEHTLHLKDNDNAKTFVPDAPDKDHLERRYMLAELKWLLPLVFLKIGLTCLTLAGGGSGGIFAPSLFVGATLGGSFGLFLSLYFPAVAMPPGVYAVVGMGAVVAGTTHGMLSAIIVVYEMTGDYRIMLPIMFAAGISSVIARFIDRESIYHKKLSRRNESVQRGHDVAVLEHVMVRDVMVPTAVVRLNDNLSQIIAFAKEHSELENLPVVDQNGFVQGMIRHSDLKLATKSDVDPHLVRAHDLNVDQLYDVSVDENLLEAISDFGASDVDCLFVVDRQAKRPLLLGALFRGDVMRRYREELLNEER